MGIKERLRSSLSHPRKSEGQEEASLSAGLVYAESGRGQKRAGLRLSLPL
jgi:hypothetical protein